MDPYATLGLQRSATQAQVKKAFRNASKRAHPDHGGKADEFHKVKRAHLVLSDPAARARFDATGEMPSEAATNPDQPALTIIAGMIGGLIDQIDEDIFTADLVAVMRHHLQQGVAAHEKNIAGLEKRIARAERLKGRFSTKGDQPNLIESVIAARLVEYSRAIDANRLGAVHGKRAVEILADYVFRADLVVQGFTFDTASSIGGWVFPKT